MISAMDPAAGRKRTPWAFWVACALAVVGGVVPILLAGTSGRANGVIFPFWFAALAMAGCALFQDRGRFPATILYLVGALAIVYGVLGMVGLLLQMTVLSPCPPAPAPCQVGFVRPMTSGESSGLNAALVLGLLAVMFGFTGMLSNYRRHRTPVQAAPPVRRLPPQPAAPSNPPAPAASAPEAADAPEAANGADTSDGRSG